MKARKRRKNLSLPGMWTELMWASWETITRRTLLMAQNTCSPTECRRMVTEKAGGRGIRIKIHLQRRQAVDDFGNCALAQPRSRQRKAPA